MVKTKPVVLLIIITFAVYFLSFFNQFVWDDEQFIYNNVFVANFDVAKIFTTNTIAGASSISNYYRPLTTLSFAWDYQIWGLNPIGFHLTNTLLHIGAGILLFYLLKHFLQLKSAAFWIALIFLLHPLQTEAVTYANSRGDSMFAFFGMASLLALSFVIEKKKYKTQIYNLKLSFKKIFFAVLSSLFYILSILGKEIGIAVLGLQALLILFWFAQSKKKTIFTFIKNNFFAISVFGLNALIAAGYLLLRATSLNFNNSFDFYDDQSLYSQSLLVRLLTFSKIIFIYLRLLFIPYPLHMERDTELVTALFSIWPILFFCLLFMIIFISWKEIVSKKTYFISFGWLWFFCMLLPVSGIIAINGLLYEHWLYVPMIGFFIAMFGTLQLFKKKIDKNTGKIFLITLCAVYALLTVRQNYLWANPIRFYTYLLKHTESSRIHNNLAMALAENGQNEEAIKHYNAALEYGIPYPNIYHNLGNTYLALEEYQKAEESYMEAISKDPSFFYSYNNLINLYVQQKKFDEALLMIKAAQAQFPNIPQYQEYETQILRLRDNS